MLLRHYDPYKCFLMLHKLTYPVIGIRDGGGDPGDGHPLLGLDVQLVDDVLREDVGHALV